MAYSYYRTSSNDSTLASYGLMAFAAVAQFAPGLIGPVLARCQPARRRSGHAAGLRHLAVHPAAAGDDHGRLGRRRLGAARPVRHRVAASAAAVRHVRLGSADPRHVLVAAGQCGHDDAGVRTLAARRRRAPACGTVPRPVCRAPVGGRRLARACACGRPAGAGFARGRRTPCTAFVFEQAQSLGRELQSSAPADRPWVQFTERLLAASIGAASARLLLTSLLRGSGMDLGEVVAVLDEAGQELRFNREILSTTLENISAGVSVVDPDMRLTAWNRRYQDMFGYPDGMLTWSPGGRPDPLQRRARRAGRGRYRSADQPPHRLHARRFAARVRAHPQRRQGDRDARPGAARRRLRDQLQRHHRLQARRKALLEANETLEQRVAERSHEAEVAQQSKTRFLAAISHDVLQPLNAARLFPRCATAIT